MFEPNAASFRLDPYRSYQELRSYPGLYFYEPWSMHLVSRYRDIQDVASSGAFVRADPITTDTGDITQNRQLTPLFDRYVQKNLLEFDGSTHRRLRMILLPLFSQRKVAADKEMVETETLRLCNEKVDSRCMDVIQDFAVPISVAVIANILGVPHSQRENLKGWADAITSVYEPGADDEARKFAETATREFVELIEDLIALKGDEQKGTLIFELAAKTADDHKCKAGEMTYEECISTCILLLNAGHEATVNALGTLCRALHDHPDQTARLQSKDLSISQAVEEGLRYDAPLHLFHRYAARDVEIAGTKLSKGDKIGLLYGAANRDGAVYDEPDSFRIDREPTPHLAFGLGEHFCVGSQLARLELQCMAQALVQYFPEWRIVDEHPMYRESVVFRGMTSLRLEK